MNASTFFPRALSSLTLALVMAGCGSTVVYNGEPEGGGGQGGGTPLPPNPPQCPASVEMYADCAFHDGTCSYVEGDCTVQYLCMGGEGCTDGGPCEAFWYWQPTSASCTPAAVDCSVAQEGDVCALPGDYCSEGECSSEEKSCGADHRWTITYYDGGDCCFDCCEPYYCPTDLPLAGDYCDPCWDSTTACVYSVETGCGLIDVGAQCDPNTATWAVDDVPVCTDPQPGG